MSIGAIIERNCSQLCVYWGNPKNDGRGGYTFDEPVELACKWEEMKQLVTDSKGNTITSRATVYLTIDVEEEGMLYNGTLDDIYDEYESSSNAIDDPRKIKGAFVIKKFDKIPALGSDSVFLRKAYLTPSLSYGGF